MCGHGEHLTNSTSLASVLERSRIAERWRTERWDSPGVQWSCLARPLSQPRHGNRKSGCPSSPRQVAAYFENMPASSRYRSAPVWGDRVTRNQGRPGFTVKPRPVFRANRVVVLLYCTGPIRASDDPGGGAAGAGNRLQILHPVSQPGSSCRPVPCWWWGWLTPACRSPTGLQRAGRQVVPVGRGPTAAACLPWSRPLVVGCVLGIGTPRPSNQARRARHHRGEWCSRWPHSGLPCPGAAGHHPGGDDEVVRRRRGRSTSRIWPPTWRVGMQITWHCWMPPMPTSPATGWICRLSRAQRSSPVIPASRRAPVVAGSGRSRGGHHHPIDTGSAGLRLAAGERLR